MASNSTTQRDADAELSMAQVAQPPGVTTSAVVPDVPPGSADAAKDTLPDLFNLEWQREGMPDTELNRKYPLDAWGEEASSNARVWKAYRDHQTVSDDRMLDSWNKTLDVLLIFAGLFSAVSTAFLIESYKALQPDYSQYVAAFLYAAAVSHNRTGGVFPALDAIVAPDRFIQTSVSQRWTNGLWFSSLVISLAVALLSILVKQWLDAYDSHISSTAASPKYWAQRHILYSRGLKRWGVPGLISFLPLLLHISLFLFFVGLILFLEPLDATISYSLLAMVSCIGVFYFLALALPAWRVECPSYTPLLAHALQELARAISGVRYIIRWTVTIRVGFPLWVVRLWLVGLVRPADTWLESIQQWSGQQLLRENKTITKHHLELDGYVLSTLINLTLDSDSHFVYIACTAIGAITSPRTRKIICRAVPTNIFQSHISRCFHYVGLEGHLDSKWTGFGITSHAQLRRAFQVMSAQYNILGWYHWRSIVYAPGLRSSLGIDGLLLQAMGVHDADGSQFDIEVLFRALQSLPATRDRPDGLPLRSTCLMFLEYYARGQVDSPLFLSCFLRVFCAGRFADTDVQWGDIEELAFSLRIVETVLRKHSIFVSTHNGGEREVACAALNGLWLMLADPERYNVDTLTAQMVEYEACKCSRPVLHVRRVEWVQLSGLSAFLRSPNFAQCPPSEEGLAYYTILLRGMSLAKCSKAQLNEYCVCMATLVKVTWDRMRLSYEAADVGTAAHLFPVEPGDWTTVCRFKPSLYSTLDDWCEPFLSAFLDGPNAIATWTGASSTDHDDKRIYELAVLARSISIAISRRRRLGRGNDVFIRGFFSGSFLLARFKDIVSREHIPTPEFMVVSFADIALDLTKHCLKLSPAGCLEICTQLEEMGDADNELRARALRLAQQMRDGIAPGGALSAECSADCPCMLPAARAVSGARERWDALVARLRPGRNASATLPNV